MIINFKSTPNRTVEMIPGRVYKVNCCERQTLVFLAGGKEQINIYENPEDGIQFCAAGNCTTCGQRKGPIVDVTYNVAITVEE